ncbi:MAG TPA: hypothetical protein VGR37_13830 [Longimicrobiaceae bacterium]|nr:hypothetical protein [Longimicrobiaceae bacterium]
MQMRKIALLLVALLAAGCGRDAIAGGYKEVETVAVGDGTPDGSASRAAAGGARWSVAVPQGTLSFTARASLVAEDGRAVPLTEQPREVRVRLDGTDRATLSRALVPPVRYTRARVVFTSVAADVTGGLTIGGLPLLGPVRVAIPAGDSVVVERAVALEPERTRETLVVDLNASAWLGAALGGNVAPAMFAAAVRIRSE